MSEINECMPADVAAKLYGNPANVEITGDFGRRLTNEKNFCSGDIIIHPTNFETHNDTYSITYTTFQVNRLIGGLSETDKVFKVHEAELRYLNNKIKRADPEDVVYIGVERKVQQLLGYAAGELAKRA